MLQVITPDFCVDSKAESRVSELAAAINTEFGSILYTPVHLLTQLLCPEEYYGLLSVADVLVMTPERDANPLLPYDFVMAQADRVDSPKGRLVLSEFTAQTKSFQSALVVNPWDHVAMARTLDQALSMPSEACNEQFSVSGT